MAEIINVWGGSVSSEDRQVKQQFHGAQGHEGIRVAGDVTQEQLWSKSVNGWKVMLISLSINGGLGLVPVLTLSSSLHGRDSWKTKNNNTGTASWQPRWYSHEA